MTDAIRAALVQTNWTGDKESMIKAHEDYARDAAAQGAKVICFQELFYGPYFCQVQKPEWYSWAEAVPDGPTVRLMCDVVRDAISKGDVHHAEEVLGRLERLASDAADDLRRTVARLHPVVMQQQGLVQALGSLAETVHEEYGIATSFTRPHGDWEAEEDRDTAIFQIAREAAVNAARHGRPPVLISLQRSTADIHLSVEDRGGGLATNGHTPRDGVGIRMMHERAARIGAELTLESAPGTRTVVSLHVPAAR